MTLGKKPFENIVGIEENAGNQHFLLFPNCFLPFPIQISIFQPNSICCLQILSIWTSLTTFLNFLLDFCICMTTRVVPLTKVYLVTLDCASMWRTYVLMSMWKAVQLHSKITKRVRGSSARHDTQMQL